MFSGMLIITSPDQKADSDYYFYVDAMIDRYSAKVHKVIKITVKSWIANCQKWLNPNSSTWTTCDSGYTLNNGEWTTASNKSDSSVTSKLKDISQIASVMRLASQLVALVITIVIAFEGLINSYSIAVIWLMINQLQILFLLLLTRAYIPDDAKYWITGFNFILNPYDFISLKKISIYGSVVNNFNFALSNSLLEQLKIKSDSTVYNISSFLSVLIFVALFHLVVFITHIIVSKMNTERKWVKLKRFIKWITWKTFHILTFKKRYWKL